LSSVLRPSEEERRCCWFLFFPRSYFRPILLLFTFLWISPSRAVRETRVLKLWVFLPRLSFPPFPFRRGREGFFSPMPERARSFFIAWPRDCLTAHFPSPLEGTAGHRTLFLAPLRVLLSFFSSGSFFCLVRREPYSPCCGTWRVSLLPEGPLFLLARPDQAPPGRRFLRSTRPPLFLGGETVSSLRRRSRFFPSSEVPPPRAKVK